MKIKFKFLLILLAVSTLLQSKQHTLKIDDIIALALEHSPDINIQRLDFKGAQERTKFTEGFYLPRLDAQVAGGKKHSTFKNRTKNTIDVFVGTLGASQLLYDFGKTAGKVSSSAQEALALEAQMQQTISDKIFALKQNYYSILKDKGIIDVQIENIKLQKQQLHRAKEYLKSGIKTIIDVSDAQVQVQQAKLALINAGYSLELQKAALEETIGMVPYGGNYTLYSQKLDMRNLSKHLPRVNMSLKTLERYAYRHRYVLSASEYYVRSANSNVESSQGDYYPTLSLDCSYTAQAVDSSVFVPTPKQQGQVMVNMKWNLFSGYQTDTSVQEAKISVLKASSQVDSVKLSVKREVLEAHIIVRQSKDNVMLSQTIAKVSLQKFGQAQKRYENELSDYVELQDAQQEYIQSLSNLVNAYYDYFIALAQLDHAVGR